MAFDKDLALAMDFKKAPDEVQKAATAHYENVKAVQKAEAALGNKKDDLDKANEAFAITEREFKAAMKRWIPEV